MIYQKKTYEKALISFGQKKKATTKDGKKSKCYQCWCFFRLEIVLNGLLLLVTFWRLRFIWLFFWNVRSWQGKFIFYHFSDLRTLHVGHFFVFVKISFWISLPVALKKLVWIHSIFAVIFLHDPIYAHPSVQTHYANSELLLKHAFTWRYLADASYFD